MADVCLQSLPDSLMCQCLEFLSIDDISRISQASQVLNREACVDHLWEALYPKTFSGASESSSGEMEGFVNRPYRRSSIGWSVSVLQDGTDTWLTGVVVDFSDDKFCIVYDLDGREEWERETMTGGAWFIAGKPRVRFLSPPSTLTADVKRARPRAPSSLDEDDILHSPLPVELPCPQRKKRRLSQSPDELSIDDSSSSCSWGASSLEDVPSSPHVCVSGCESPSNHSWRCEAYRDHVMAPTGIVGEIKAHTDEVLCVAFSNSTRRLASCSRDGSTMIFDFLPHQDTSSNATPTFSVNASVVIQHGPGEIPCRVSWSPDDTYLLVSTEARNGNIFDYDAQVACYDAKSGKRLMSRPNIPFDVCAAWIAGTSAFIHGEALTVSPRGTYHQTLAMSDCEQNRVVGRFHFRFLQETFIHLIQVSPDGNLLAFTCGIGDALSDTVRVVRIPRITSTASTVDIKVPRLKFTAQQFVSNSIFSALRTRKIVNLSSVPMSKLMSITAPCGDGDNVVPSFFCGGAVLGLVWGKDSKKFYTNTRKYIPKTDESSSLLSAGNDVIPAGLMTDRPDLDNTLEVQEWSIADDDLCEVSGPKSAIRGAHGFTTKDCPFYLFLAESPCGEYIASGSEDCGVYVYHARHKRLLRVLHGGHDDVVSMVSWAPPSFFDAGRPGCLLATASDDKRILLWSNRSCGAKLIIDGF